MSWVPPGQGKPLSTLKCDHGECGATVDRGLRGAHLAGWDVGNPLRLHICPEHRQPPDPEVPK